MADGSAAEAAYQRALQEIEKVRAEGGTELKLTGETFADLDRLPQEVAEIHGLASLILARTKISDLSPLGGQIGLKFLMLRETAVSDLSHLRDLRALESLSLNQTAVSDLFPLKGLTTLRGLWLSETAVRDLSPLRYMIALDTLSLNQTAVSDLRPIAALPFIRSMPISFGLRFRDTPAASVDPELHRLSQIENDEQRTRETLAYLKTLPPWPEPYTPATRGDVPVPRQIGPSENRHTSKIARKEPPMSRGAIKAKTSTAHIRFLQREPEVTQLTAQSVAAQIRDAMLEMRRRSNDIPDALLKFESLADALDGIGNAPLGPKGEKRIKDLQLRIAQLEAVIEKLTVDLSASKAAIANPNGFAATFSKEAAREIATTLGFLTRLGAIAGLVYFIGPTNPVATGLIGAWAAITKLAK